MSRPDKGARPSCFLPMSYRLMVMTLFLDTLRAIRHHSLPRHLAHSLLSLSHLAQPHPDKPASCLVLTEAYRPTSSSHPTVVVARAGVCLAARSTSSPKIRRLVIASQQPARERLLARIGFTLAYSTTFSRFGCSLSSSTPLQRGKLGEAVETTPCSPRLRVVLVQDTGLLPSRIVATGVGRFTLDLQTAWVNGPMGVELDEKNGRLLRLVRVEAYADVLDEEEREAGEGMGAVDGQSPSRGLREEDRR